MHAAKSKSKTKARSKADDISTNRWQLELKRLSKELANLGPDSTSLSAKLRRAVLTKQIDQLHKSRMIEKQPKQLQEELTQQLKSLGLSTPRPIAKIALDTRLYPAVKGQVNLLEVLPPRKAAAWRLRRTYMKRMEVLTGKEHSDPSMPSTRVNPIDVCRSCGVERYTDREASITVCSNPKCGDNYTNYGSHVYDTKDNERDDHDNTRSQFLEHLKKFTDQYERGHPEAPLETLAKLTGHYNKIHFHDLSKVQTCRTNQLLKTCRDIPKQFRRAPDRMTKELKSESIPEYSGSQINLLLNQRKRLRMPDDQPSNDDHKQKKSFNNQIYIRQLGRANGMEQARLHYNAKTTKIHTQRVWALEKECLVMQDRYGDQKDMTWNLFPST